VLQCAKVCYGKLQCVAVCCSVSQCFQVSMQMKHTPLASGPAQGGALNESHMSYITPREKSCMRPYLSSAACGCLHRCEVLMYCTLSPIHGANTIANNPRAQRVHVFVVGTNRQREKQGL